MQILADEDPETVLPAALTLAAVHPEMPLERVRRQHRALLDRARGSDGPGRAAAATALANVPGLEVDEILRNALVSLDPSVRTAAAGAIGLRDTFPPVEILKLADDPEPRVRAALLRSLARLGERRGDQLGADWRDVLIFLADDSPVAAAAGEALIAIAGGERARLAEEMLAQGDSIRRAAIEEIARTADPEAAAAVAIAVGHEDLDTVRAVLKALEIAPQPVAEEAAVTALSDSRPEVRESAAVLLSRRGVAPAKSSVSDALARTLVEERDPQVLKALLEALCVAGGESALEPLTAILAREKVEKEALDAAASLARRYEREVKRLWVSAPARAERRWAAALAAAAKSRSEEKGTTA
jgi:HEAT repeat protein